VSNSSLNMCRYQAVTSIVTSSSECSSILSSKGGRNLNFRITILLEHRELLLLSSMFHMFWKGDTKDSNSVAFVKILYKQRPLVNSDVFVAGKE
jgi:hypothetical protein